MLVVVSLEKNQLYINLDNRKKKELFDKAVGMAPAKLILEFDCFEWNYEVLKKKPIKSFILLRKKKLSHRI